MQIQPKNEKYEGPSQTRKHSLDINKIISMQQQRLDRTLRGDILGLVSHHNTQLYQIFKYAQEEKNLQKCAESISEGKVTFSVQKFWAP